MTESEKIVFFDLHRLGIHEAIKTHYQPKSLWRKLFWTTQRDSNQYKAGCVDIFKAHFQELYRTLQANSEGIPPP